MTGSKDIYHLVEVSGSPSVIQLTKNLLIFLREELGCHPNFKTKVLIISNNIEETDISQLRYLAAPIELNVIDKKLVSLLHFFLKKKPKFIILQQLPNFRARILTIVLSVVAQAKYIWIVWGGDLYDSQIAKKDNEIVSLNLLKNYLIRNVNKILVSNMFAVGAISADLKNFERFYPNNNVLKREIRFPNPLLPNFEPKLGRKINVLISHSASPLNKHVEVLDKLSQYKDFCEFNVISILSYGGSKQYVEKVRSHGLKTFGNRFYTQCDFMGPTELNKFLRNINIGCFIFERQAAITTCLNLISLGAKLILHPNSPTLTFLEENGIQCYSFDSQQSAKSFFQIEREVLIRNSKHVRMRWDNTQLGMHYRQLIEECISI